MIPDISGALKTPLLGAELMKNAEVVGSIYIKAFFTRSANKLVSKQGYADLIKASWILIDIIARHPQLNRLDATIRYDAVLLADVWYYPSAFV